MPADYRPGSVAAALLRLDAALRREVTAAQRETAHTDSPGGETVAVYFADARGNRKTGWRLFVVASRAGNSASKSLSIPTPKPDARKSAVGLIVRVENASGKRSSGDYTLQASR